MMTNNIWRTTATTTWFSSIDDYIKMNTNKSNLDNLKQSSNIAYLGQSCVFICLCCFKQKLEFPNTEKVNECIPMIQHMKHLNTTRSSKTWPKWCILGPSAKIKHPIIWQSQQCFESSVPNVYAWADRWWLHENDRC